jgi:putative two-component system response regulator
MGGFLNRIRQEMAAESGVDSSAIPGWERNRRPRVLAVDDQPAFLGLLKAFLSGLNVDIETASDGVSALDAVRRRPPDLVLLDINMSGRNGFEVCRAIKSSPATRLLPVVMITGRTGVSDHVLALEAGADDLLPKPLIRAELVARVRSLLRLKNVYDELDDADHVIFALAAAVEAKDNYGEDHTERVALTSRALGLRLGLSEPQLDTLYRGGMIHDIGKLGIPDAILQKKGPLDQAETVLMQTHPLVGEQIVAPLRSAGSLREIVRNHHEHYDGEGYPDQLKGDDIPILARIVAVADAFDALVSDRPYRPGRTSEEAVGILRDGSGTQWDPQVVALFATELVDFHTRLRAG